MHKTDNLGIQEKPYVSIIVPIYNAGEVLKDCLNTLVNQTLKNIEIICVLDAPTDNSAEIVKQFALYDNRIKVLINKTNVHISNSRNKGILEAKAEYIGFSDQDDTRDLQMYELLFSKAKEEDADIVFSNSIVKYNDKTESVKYYCPNREEIIRSIILPTHIDSNHNKLSKSVWASIYKKEYIEDSALTFKDRRLFYEEDTLFNLKAFLSTGKISYVNKDLYFWNKCHIGVSSKSVENIANLQFNYFLEIYKYICEARQFNNYVNELRILISECIWDKTNYYQYLKLDSNHKQNLLKLFRKIHFPLTGKSNNLKLLSRKRIRIFFFICGLIISSRNPCKYLFLWKK